MSDTLADKPVFSFVVPLFNEQDGLEAFYDRLTSAAEKLGDSYEIVFVNDGSDDRTAEILRRLSAGDESVRIVEFSRNFGHQVAVTAGYDHAAGQAVISLDGDCQHPPEMISELISRWREGFEVVYTVRKDTDGISPIRRMVGRCVYRMIAAASGMDLTDQADFRLLDRKALDAVNACREQGRLVRGLVRSVGFRQISVPYVAEKRAAGKSSYSFGQLAKMAGEGVFGFSLAPLRLAALLGLAMLAVVAVFAVGSAVLWPFGLAPGPFARLTMFIVAMFGVQFLLLGILGEYVGRTFEQAKARPLYIVREKINFPADQPDQATKKAAKDEEPQKFCVWT